MIKSNDKSRKSYKYERISSEVDKLIKEVVMYEIQDKRVNGNAVVTGTILSKDFSHCKVFVYINSEDKIKALDAALTQIENKKSVLDGLKNASGFVRHVIAQQLDMRKTPEISFIYDESVDRMNRIEELLNQIK